MLDGAKVLGDGCRWEGMSQEYLLHAALILILWAQLCLYTFTRPFGDEKTNSRIFRWGTVAAVFALVGEYFYPLKGIL